MASMKAAEAMEWGKDQGPRKEAKGRFCITTVKSSPKLTSRACDTDTCVALETGALFPLDHPQWGGGHRVHLEPGWQEAAVSGSQRCMVQHPHPLQGLPHSLLQLHSDLPGEGGISPATPWKTLGGWGKVGRLNVIISSAKRASTSPASLAQGSTGREAPGVVNNSIC